MAKNKDLKRCPVCGSRNLQVEGHGGKGRKLVHCAECDHEFELHVGAKDDHRPSVKDRE